MPAHRWPDTSTSLSLFVDLEESDYTDFFQGQNEAHQARQEAHQCRRAVQDARTSVPYQSRAKNPPKLHRVPAEVFEGKRSADALAWTEDEAFLSDLRAPASPAERVPEHCCPLCLSLFSHPVVNGTCGHAYCYLCICGRLQSSFRCPISGCNVLTVRSAPMQVPALETALAGLYAVHYPNWLDTSEVSYSFNGLTFPRRERISASASASFPYNLS
ncbi:hypothetical protein C8F01DRAFT_1090067 [Mycena amicta]|nr:hypothetical protein C8F01DRAFT_1090067 [Mycena amicta]